jgi:exo-1,4-beta-D-glucosaminidase
VWGGGVAPPDEFFDLADELGIMVWQDFFVTGDGQGLWGQGDQDWPADGDLFLENVESVIKRLRHHPSLFVYTGGNEGHAREELFRGMRDLAAELDGTRPWLPSTGNVSIPPSWGGAYPDDQVSGTISGGPHWWVPESFYFHYARLDPEWLFNNEVGVATVTPMRSLEKFILDFDADPGSELYPLNAEWAYHDAVDAPYEEGTMWSAYDAALRARYGEVTSAEDYVAKGTLVSVNAIRAMYEAVNEQLERCSGLLIWKINSSWPSLMWQMYDWYLRPNAAYYFVKKANELIHVQLEAEDDRVSIVNRGLEDMEDVTVEIEILTDDLTSVEKITEEVDLPANTLVQVTEELDIPYELGVLYFLKLTARDADGELLSDNFYWKAEDNDFTGLGNLSEVELDVSGSTETADGEVTATVEVENNTGDLAFFANLLILDGNSGDEVLPTFWSDNYLILLPGESKTVTAVISEDDLDGAPRLAVEGWNIAPSEIAL